MRASRILMSTRIISIARINLDRNQKNFSISCNFVRKIMKYRITICLTIHMMKLIIYSWNMTP